ncbi:MAG: SoxR reducing system RseC family protein [Bacillota bacterium]|nr:SoxR reducing system RseC family protein [Bacillota bacterium]
MEQYGVVTQTNDERAKVSLQRHLACKNCGRCGMLSGSGGKDVVIEALNPIKAQPGQRVMLESDDRQVLFVAFMLYVVPLVGLVAGIFAWLKAAASLGFTENQELISVAIGFGVMIIAFILIRIWDNRVKDDPKYKPVITTLIAEEPECRD